MRSILLFDIDGVIRDVTHSYRLAIQKTVDHFIGWHPSIEDIDELKKEGCWNNDWDATMELIHRHESSQHSIDKWSDRSKIIEVFNNYYFGGNPEADPSEWEGFIRNEPLLVTNEFFTELNLKDFAWGFVSGAEPASAKFVLETRLNLKNPPLIAMGDAPEKPNPTGLIQLASKLAKNQLGRGVPPIAYLGDTVADVITIKNARELFPQQEFLSLAVAPPHLHDVEKQSARVRYEQNLKNAGADKILISTSEVIEFLIN